jgi:plastocyanin
VTANANQTFTPNTVTIALGDTVTFRNGGGLHNAVSNPGSVTAFRCANGCDGAGGNGNPSSAAWSATVAFPAAATIGYFCDVHGAPGVGMAGRILVSARRSDFNGDGLSDILWRSTSTGANVIWRSANSATPTAVTTQANQAWSVVGTGDYNGDGRADILWRNGSTGANVIWRSGSSATPQAVTTRAVTWRVVGSGDYSGDRIADILWRNTSTGANQIWRSASSATPQAVTTQANLAWNIVGSGDYNDDGRADILWRNSSTGANVIWRSASSATPTAVSTQATVWIVGAEN